MQEVDKLKPVLVEKKRNLTKNKRSKAATGQLSEPVLTDYASTNFNKTEGGVSTGAMSPVKFDVKGLDIAEMNDLQVQISLESKEEKDDKMVGKQSHKLKPQAKGSLTFKVSQQGHHAQKAHKINTLNKGMVNPNDISHAYSTTSGFKNIKNKSKEFLNRDLLSGGI